MGFPREAWSKVSEWLWDFLSAFFVGLLGLVFTTAAVLIAIVSEGSERWVAVVTFGFPGLACMWHFVQPLLGTVIGKVWKIDVYEKWGWPTRW